MKLGEVQKTYQAQYRDLIDYQRKLYQQREQLNKKISGEDGGKEKYQEEAATLELSIQEVKSRVDENREFLDQLTERYAAIWNSEVARQQSDAAGEMAQDILKLMEVARRIARGGIVPASDEKKLMEYSMEMYQMAKSMASINREKREKYDSLWGEEKEEKEYDPEGKAENASVGDIEMPELVEITE